MRSVVTCAACAVFLLGQAAQAQPTRSDLAAPHRTKGTVALRPKTDKGPVASPTMSGTLGPTKKSKQDIADEKKLEHDLKICIGC